MRIGLIIFFLLLTLLACVETPIPPGNNIGDLGEHGAYILCEGLYGQNNSSISRYDLTYQTTYNNFFQLINKEKIGDTANDLVIRGDTAFIAVSTQKKIIIFNTKSGKFLSEIIINDGRFLRKMVILNDSMLFVTDLYAHCFWVVNYRKNEIIKKVITGPAPEGIAVFENYIFVANSGLGDYLSLEPEAGTVSVFEGSNLNHIKSLNNLPNVLQLKISHNNGKLYARYNHLPKHEDSLGGIVEFDIQTLSETRRWLDKAGQFAISPSSDSLFYISDEGIKFINLKINQDKPELFIMKTKKTDYWYSIEYNNDEIWIGNAKDYQSKGEILIFSIKNPQYAAEKFDIGINPNTIVFF